MPTTRPHAGAPSRPRLLRAALAAGSTLVLAGALAGCGSDGATGSDDAAPSGPAGLSIVASTDVWGDIAQAVGGDDVEVTSIISDPSQDPHSFEANSKTLLAISTADVVIENGGGYDDFMDTMLKTADSSATVINAVDISGHTAPAGGELNEHVWYDLPTVGLVADKIAAELGERDAAHAADYRANAQAFDADVQTLVDREATDRPTVEGRAIAITEPVPLYLTDALGLVNDTPPAFSEAVEEGDDVSVSVLQQTLDLFSSGDVDALVYNAQTAGPVTEQVLKAAQDAGVAVVPVTETLPDGMDYLQWMGANLDAVVKAVGA